MSVWFAVGLFLGVVAGQVSGHLFRQAWRRRKHGDTASVVEMGDGLWAASCKCGWTSGLCPEAGAAFLAGYHRGEYGL